jgi:hypothetical protein
MVTPRKQPIFEIYHFAAGSRISQLQSFYPEGLWRENTRFLGSNDVAAQMHAAGDESNG